MSAPRHLWSGDWRQESAAAARELAQRRTAGQAPGESSLPSPSRPTPTAGRALARLRSLRAHPARGAVLTALAMLLSAAAGYAIAASLISTGGKHAPRATRSSTSISRPAVATAAGPPWLGVDTTDLPGAPGVVVVSVFAGSPAAAAGLEPGDVITGVGARPVRTEADLGAILAGLKAGERVEIQYQRGPLSATAQATLAPRPPHTP